jgi:pimeloyl-ACP methyl ester carboxylesterase
MRSFLALMLAAACSWTAAPAHADGTAIGTQRLYEVRGVKLYVETYGSGAPLVFLHGGLHFFGNSFEKQRDYFASFRKVIGIDQRGHGHSPDNSQPFSYREMVEDTAALLEQLGTGPVDVVGHSDGGNVGLLLARDHPQLVRRLVISGANLTAGKSADELKRLSQRPPQEVAEKLPPGFRADYLKVTPDDEAHWMTVVAKSWQLWMTPVILEAADLKTMKMPVLVIAGDHDFNPVEKNVEIFRGLPQGQLLILPATGHGTFNQRAEMMNLTIRTFLEQPDRDEGSR